MDRGDIGGAGDLAAEAIELAGATLLFTRLEHLGAQMAGEPAHGQRHDQGGNEVDDLCRLEYLLNSGG